VNYTFYCFEGTRVVDQEDLPSVPSSWCQGVE
jgi:hypothetical protein